MIDWWSCNLNLHVTLKLASVLNPRSEHKLEEVGTDLNLTFSTSKTEMCLRKHKSITRSHGLIKTLCAQPIVVDQIRQCPAKIASKIVFPEVQMGGGGCGGSFTVFCLVITFLRETSDC